MKTIIVATDFSREAENAMAFAANAAGEQGYELILFTLYNISIHALNARMPSHTLEDILSKKNNELKEAAESVALKYGIKVTPHFASGNFYEEVKWCIAQNNADMLVMGMPKKSLEQDLLGNTTTSAINRLMIPILSIPLGVSYNGIKHILFACDIIRGIHKQPLEQVRLVAADFGAVVEIFHVSEKVRELQQAQRETIQGAMDGVEYYYNNIAAGEVIKAIQQEAINIKADLLIMVPYKYGFWSSLVHRSKTRIMASGNNIPLLAIPM